MAHAVAQTTPCCFCKVYDIMVPDYSSCANSNSAENPKFADILTTDQQFPNISAHLRQLPLNATQNHLLYAIAGPYGRQWQQCLCFNTNAGRLSHPARAGLLRRLVSVNKRNIVILSQVNVGLLRGLNSLTPLCSSGVYERKSYFLRAHTAENPPDTTPANTLITVHLSIRQ